MTCVFSFFFFKQKTAYEMRISDWSSDVCSSDLEKPATSSGAGVITHCTYVDARTFHKCQRRFNTTSVGLTSAGSIHWCLRPSHEWHVTLRGLLNPTVVYPSPMHQRHSILTGRTCVMAGATNQRGNQAHPASA